MEPGQQILARLPDLFIQHRNGEAHGGGTEVQRLQAAITHSGLQDPIWPRMADSLPSFPRFRVGCGPGRFGIYRGIYPDPGIWDHFSKFKPELSRKGRHTSKVYWGNTTYSDIKILNDIMKFDSEKGWGVAQRLLLRRGDGWSYGRRRLVRLPTSI